MGFDGTHSFVVKLALDLPSRGCVPYAAVAEHQLEAKGRCPGRSKDFSQLVEHASPRNGGSTIVGTHVTHAHANFVTWLETCDRPEEWRLFGR